MFSHSFMGLCAWDLPALLVLVLMIVLFAGHRYKMRKREREYEDELSDRWAGESGEQKADGRTRRAGRA